MKHRAAVLAAALLLLASCSSSGPEAGAATPAPTTRPAAGADVDAAGVPADTTAGCGTPADVDPVRSDPPGDVAQTFPSGGVERVYRLAVPTDYDPDVAAPLVLNLHGSGSDALQASVYGHVPQAATERGMIVVTPEAIDHNWQLGGGTDAEFLEALVDDVEARYCIDQDRVHIMGMSLGAWKAASTACAEPDRYASAALVTVEVFPGTCDPLAVVAFHGTADTTVPYGEGADPGIEVHNSNAGLPGALHNIAAWAANGGCEPEPEVTEIGDDVVLRRFAGCDPGVDVELYTIRGGGHTWPGADIDIAAPGLTTHTIAATEISLDWFEAHPEEAVMTAIELVIDPRERHVGSSTVHRLLPFHQRRMVGPFIFLDRMGPEEAAAGTRMDIDAHPHIGLSTLTYLFAGRLVHRDSTGAVQVIEPGAVNWMTAGGGVCHTERSHPDDVDQPREHHGLQLWVALPDGAEDGAPSFQHQDAGAIPSDVVGGARIRVAAGTGWGLTSPVVPSSPLVLAEIALEEGSAVAIDASHPERAVVAIDDDVSLGGERLPAGRLAVLAPGTTPELRGRGRAVVIGGEPVGPRHIWWNFVHADPERIEHAKAEWSAQRFPLVPGDHDPWVPLPTS